MILACIPCTHFFFFLHSSLIFLQVIAYGKLSGQLSSNALQLASRDHINMGLGAASVLGLASKLHEVPDDNTST